MDKRVLSTYYRIGIITVLALAITALIVWKSGRQEGTLNRTARAVDSLPTQDTLAESVNETPVEPRAEAEEVDVGRPLSGNAPARVKSETTATFSEDPLTRALKSGRPVVADFGRGTCIPCKMMQPILEKLQEEYEGRAEILIIDVGEYATLSRQCGIMVIPTQIFFDARGNEIERHQGFMPEEDIVALLRRLGVE